MPIPKNLTFTAVPTRSHDPVAARRAKLVERLEEQKTLLADAAHVRKSTRWTGKGDERRQVERERPKPRSLICAAPNWWCSRLARPDWGQVQQGEGVYGLRRALVLAGARAQLVSLWKVADAQTQALMVDSRSGALFGVRPGI